MLYLCHNLKEFHHAIILIINKTLLIKKNQFKILSLLFTNFICIIKVNLPKIFIKLIYI